MSNRLKGNGLSLLPLDERVLDLGRLRRLRRAIGEADCGAAVFVDAANIRYATGTSNMQVYAGHNPCRYVFVPVEGPVILFEFSNCAHLSAGRAAVDEVRPAISWYHFVSGPRVAANAERWAAELSDLTRRHGGGNLRLAIDRVDPAGTWALQRHGIEIRDGQAVASFAKKVKAAEEIKAVRNAVAVCDEGLRRMHAALEPGITEQRLWSFLHQANAELGGEWIETRLLSAGQRTNPWYNECGDYVIASGDLVSFDTDLVGRHGYAVDISRSWLTGDGRATDDQRRLYGLAYAQIHRNIEMLKPGRRFSELAAAAYKLPDAFVPRMNRALAHGIGLCNEYPLVINEEYVAGAYDGVVEEGMVLCVESYVGEVGGREGVKLEEQVLIADDGAVKLSSYPFDERLL